jgi:hypothetical protein
MFGALVGCGFGALVGCGPTGIAIAVKEPTSIRVSYISGHNLFRGAKFPNPQLHDANGDVVAPADEDGWAIEAHRTTKYYVVGPGEYRLFEHRHPVVKTIRRREPMRFVGDHVSAVLDAKTDANSERGETTEVWRIEPQHAQRYFVLLTEEEIDAGEDFWVEVVGVDKGGRDVGGATWLGPFERAVTIEVSMWGTRKHRYEMRVVRPTSEQFEERTSAIGSGLEGKLGPGTANWSPVSKVLDENGLRDQMGWVASVRVPNDHERTMYVVAAWKPDHPYLDAPWIQVFDDAGRVDVVQILRSVRDRYEWTGVFTTKKPVRGDLHVRFITGVSELTSGRYLVCVGADPKGCDVAVPPDTRLLGW